MRPKEVVHLAPDEQKVRAFTGYERLANAIVAQACREYSEALDADDRRSVVALERFFRSSWCGLLTKLDTEWLMKQIQKNRVNGRYGRL